MDIGKNQGHGIYTYPANGNKTRVVMCGLKDIGSKFAVGNFISLQLSVIGRQFAVFID